jgi:hypothetical protein
MASASTLARLAPLALLLALTACPAKKTDLASASSIACSIPTQDRCREVPQPSAAQRAAVTVECSSASGKLSSPASCPTAGFVGKCTVPAVGTAAAEVKRFYKADDAAYQKSFCVDTVKGAWSTTF